MGLITGVMCAECGHEIEYPVHPCTKYHKECRKKVAKRTSRISKIKRIGYSYTCEEIEQIVYNIVIDFINTEYGGIKPKYIRTTRVYIWGMEHNKIPVEWTKRVCKGYISKYMPKRFGYNFCGETNTGILYIRAD